MHKLSSLAIPLAMLIVTSLFTAAAYADVTVGVKIGDWITYTIVTTGNLENHDSQWATMNVTDLQGPIIILNVTTLFNNGTYFYEPDIVLNLQTGHLGDDFFIPANMSVGQAFYDARIGNVTITSSQQKTYVGAVRTVLTGTVVTTNGTEITTFEWDKQTGVWFKPSPITLTSTSPWQQSLTAPTYGNRSPYQLNTALCAHSCSCDSRGGCYSSFGLA